MQACLRSTFTTTASLERSSGALVPRPGVRGGALSGAARSPSLGLRCVWLLAMVLLPAVVRAQASTADKAAAQMLFERGLDLMRKGQYAQACEQLERSQAIERGIGTMLYLAECYERTGRTASAWALFREAASAAGAQGEVERANAGTARADKLEPQLSRLTINVGQDSRVAGLTIVRNGTPVPPGVWGLPTPIDPGEQTIKASAPGYVTWSLQVTLPPNGASLSVDVPQLAAVPGQPKPEPEPPPAVAADKPLFPVSGGQPQRDRPTQPTFQKPLGLVLGGVGVVGLGIAAVFGANAIAKHHDERAQCPDAVCPSRSAAALAQRYNSEAHDAATLSNVFAVGGAVLVATGLVLYFTAPKKVGVMSVGVHAAAGGAGIELGGRL